MDALHWLDLIRYGLGALMALALPPAIVYWFIVHPFIGFWRRVGARGTLWVLAVFYLGSMAALFPLRHVLLGRDLGTSVVNLIVAAPLLVVSGIISRQRRRHLTMRTLAGVPELAPQEAGPGLLTEGIYGKIRHPRYVEFTLGMIGWALFVNYVGLYVITGLSFVLLYLIVLMEERELRERFGQGYVDYSARVPRFVPRIKMLTSNSA
jgi:protein-S-isoprenylcysteine O-methyltransferase Ste14